MGRREFDAMRRGIAMTGIASTWAICVSTVEDWQTAPVIMLTVVLFVLGVIKLVQGAIELQRDSNFY